MVKSSLKITPSKPILLRKIFLSHILEKLTQT